MMTTEVNTEETEKAAAVEEEADYDGKILAQERLLEKEVQESAPVVGPKTDFGSLAQEYATDPVYLQKIADLQSRYSSLRRTRGDGNCFFRAFGFAYFEYLLLLSDSSSSSPASTAVAAAERKAFKQRCTDMKDLLISTLGFPQFTVEDFHDTFVEAVEKLDPSAASATTSVDGLLETFNDQGLSDYLIVFLRLITSGQLQKDADFYVNFVDGGRGVKDFCNQEVEPMNKESDHIHIIALAMALDVSVAVEYMDRGAGDQCVQHVFPEGTSPKIFLLYRPGHYDILYRAEVGTSAKTE